MSSLRLLFIPDAYLKARPCGKIFLRRLPEGHCIVKLLYLQAYHGWDMCMA